jgi:hypothetical protein
MVHSILNRQRWAGERGELEVADLQSAPPVRAATYRADAHSVILLCADLQP